MAWNQWIHWKKMEVVRNDWFRYCSYKHCLPRNKSVCLINGPGCLGAVDMWMCSTMLLLSVHPHRTQLNSLKWPKGIRANLVVSMVSANGLTLLGACALYLSIIVIYSVLLLISKAGIWLIKQGRSWWFLFGVKTIFLVSFKWIKLSVRHVLLHGISYHIIVEL